jgi:uncharacterized phage infection (PIP) family protein YhgE
MSSANSDSDKIDQITQQIEQIDEQIAIIKIQLSQDKDKLSKDDIEKGYETIAKLEQQQTNLGDNLSYELSKLPDTSIIPLNRSMKNVTIHSEDEDDNEINRAASVIKDVQDKPRMKLNNTYKDGEMGVIFETTGKAITYNKGVFHHDICYMQLLSYKEPGPTKCF